MVQTHGLLARKVATSAQALSSGRALEVFLSKKQTRSLEKGKDAFPQEPDTRQSHTSSESFPMRIKNGNSCGSFEKQKQHITANAKACCCEKHIIPNAICECTSPDTECANAPIQA
jgi:hypothetical protein